VERTASYQAIDQGTAVWTGIPGYLDAEYQNNFWTPLPKHNLDGASPADFVSAENAARLPLGYGPYTTAEWNDSEIKLVKNPYYNPAPKMDALIFKAVGSDGQANLQKIQSGECDLISPQALGSLSEESLLGLEADGGAQLAWADGHGWEALHIGIRPYSYDIDGYKQVSGDRPSYFGDVRTRQAIALCLDRQSMVQNLAFGQPAVMNTYLPPTHPLYNPQSAAYAYDPAAANQLFVEAGWSEYTGGPRRNIAVADIFGGIPFEVTYLYEDNPSSAAIAQSLAQNLSDCGITPELIPLSAEELFATGADAPVFGRDFDLVQFSWQTAAQPPCHLYLSEAIPGEDTAEFLYGWGGWNLTGWQNAEYDAACQAARGALPGESGYVENHMLAQSIFANELPVIPLFTHQQVIAARSDLCGLAFDSTAGLLWNVENLAYGEYCAEG
jgi:peptide/nickel transport system substrate-binding protein